MVVLLVDCIYYSDCSFKCLADMDSVACDCMKSEITLLVLVTGLMINFRSTDQISDCHYGDVLKLRMLFDEVSVNLKGVLGTFNDKFSVSKKERFEAFFNLGTRIKYEKMCFSRGRNPPCEYLELEPSIIFLPAKCFRVVMRVLC